MFLTFSFLTCITQDNDEDDENPLPCPEPERSPVKSPVASPKRGKVMMENGRRKRQKLVDKMYQDEEGFFGKFTPYSHIYSMI